MPVLLLHHEAANAVQLAAGLETTGLHRSELGQDAEIIETVRRAGYRLRRSTRKRKEDEA